MVKELEKELDGKRAEKTNFHTFLFASRPFSLSLSFRASFPLVGSRRVLVCALFLGQMNLDGTQKA